jgi:hypothetical protein
MTDVDLLLIFAGPAEQPNAGADVIVGAGRPGFHTSRWSG